MKPRSQIYFEAAAYINEHGLAHGTYVRPSGQHCTIGAVVKAAGLDVARVDDRVVIGNRTAEDLGFTSGQQLVNWNDRATKVTVVRRLLRAAVAVMG